MEISILLMKKIAELFIMIFMGFGLVKLKFLKSEDSKSLSIISLYLITPCMLLGAFQLDCSPEKIAGLIATGVMAVILHMIFMIITRLLEKPMGLDPVEKTSIIYSNAGNLIIPIVTSILGPEWVFYTCSFSCVQLFLLWSHGKSVLQGQKSLDIKKVFLNINIIFAFLGLMMFILGIRLPSILGSAVSSVGSMIAPVSMFVTGMIMGGIDFKTVFAKKRVYLMVCMRLVVYPLISLIVIWLTGIYRMVPNGNVVLLITFLATITPAASTVVQMAQLYDRDGEYASAINVTTTLGCIVTMPILVGLYNMLIPVGL